MTRILTALHQDETGFIISAELVLISTIAVVGMVVGLAEVAYGVNEELEDVGSAVGQIQQSYCISGTCGHKAHVCGSEFCDVFDYCDGQFDISCNSAIGGEGRGFRFGFRY